MKVTKLTKKTKNNGGFIVSLELLLISTILVIGLVTGLVAVRDATVHELEDTAAAINNIDQSYEYHGLEHVGQYNGGGANSQVCRNFTAGSVYIDDVEDLGVIFCIAPTGDQ
jgi:hypothetical protein